MLQRLTRLICLLSLFWGSNAALAENTGRVVLETGTGMYTLSAQMAILKDPDGDFRINQLLAGAHADQWFRTNEAVPNLGYNKSIFWFRTTVRNLHSSKTSWLLSIDYPMHDYLDIYLVQQGKIDKAYHVGDKLPHSHRPIDHRNFVFPVSIPLTEDVDIYIRLETAGSIKLPVLLWEERSEERRVGKECR